MFYKIIFLLTSFITGAFLSILFIKTLEKRKNSEKRKTLIEYIKNSISLYKQPLKIQSLNKKINDLWISMGKPSYPLPEDIIIMKELSSIFSILMFVSISSLLFAKTMWLMAILIGIAAFFIPDILLKQQSEQRLKQIERDLPFAIDILTLCVEAGIDFMSAISKIIENSDPGPLRDEFYEVIREIQLGSNRREALINLSKRCKLEDVTSFVSVIVQAEELGTSLVNILRDYSEEMRTKKWQKGEKQALEAPTKMLFPMMVFIFPGVFILIFGPVVLQIMEMFK